MVKYTARDAGSYLGTLVWAVLSSQLNLIRSYLISHPTIQDSSNSPNTSKNMALSAPTCGARSSDAQARTELENNIQDIESVCRMIAPARLPLSLQMNQQ